MTQPLHKAQKQHKVQEPAYHFSQQGAAGVQHEGVCVEQFSTVHLELHVAELRVVHHPTEV